MKSILKWHSPYKTFFAFFVVLCSGLWMTEIMPISPFYLVVIPIFFFPFFDNYKIGRKCYTTKTAYFVCFLMFVYLILQPALTDSTIHNNFVLAFCFVFYIFCDSILSSMDSKDDYAKLIKYFSVITVIYMIFDFIKRYSSADFGDVPAWIEANPIFRFYLLKGHGLHGDSNNSAAIALTVLSLLYFYRKFIHYKNKKFTFIFVALFVCTIGTCSRAALLAFLVLIMFYNFFYKQNIYIKVLDVAGIVLFFILALYILSVDPSGRTKLYIFEETWNYLWTENDIAKLSFGYGGNNSMLILGLYAHNPISIYLIEYGLVGFVLYIFVYMLLMLDAGFFSLFVFVPYVVFSLSFSPLHTTFLFASISLVKHGCRIFNLEWSNKKSGGYLHA